MQRRCQRLLAIWVGARGGALERRECRVDLERLSNMLRALGFETVVAEAASEGRARVSAATDSLGMGGRSSALERRERRVDHERLCDVLGSLGFNAVAGEAASEGGTNVSAAADSLGSGNGRRT